MFEELTSPEGENYCISRYSPGCLDSPPWGAELFDCLIIYLDQKPLGNLVERLAEDVSAANTDWVETLGPLSQELHDAVDAASVRIGRQEAIGEGSPMTAWDETVTSIEAVAEYLRFGGLGYQQRKCVLIVGSAPDAKDLAAQLRGLYS